MAEYLLEMKQIVKQFPGTLALDHVDFTLEQGEVGKMELAKVR